MMNKSTEWWHGHYAAEYEYHSGDCPPNPYPIGGPAATQWQEGYEEWWRQAELYDEITRVTAKGISHAE